MKIIIKKENLPMSAEQIARRASYGFIYDKRRGKGSFVRHPNRGRYPRFHMYLKEENGKIIFDLHLDQKETSYKGAHMHNAEYEGEAVEQEILRIKKIISDLYQKSPSASSVSTISAGAGDTHEKDVKEDFQEPGAEEKSLEEKIGHAEIDKNLKEEKKKSWWKFWG